MITIRSHFRLYKLCTSQIVAKLPTNLITVQCVRKIYNKQVILSHIPKRAGTMVIKVRLTGGEASGTGHIRCHGRAICFVSYVSPRRSWEQTLPSTVQIPRRRVSSDWSELYVTSVVTPTRSKPAVFMKRGKLFWIYKISWRKKLKCPNTGLQKTVVESSFVSLLEFCLNISPDQEKMRCERLVLSQLLLTAQISEGLTEPRTENATERERDSCPLITKILAHTCWN